jgi:quinoprotein glucose dehydrogenase
MKRLLVLLLCAAAASFAGSHHDGWEVVGGSTDNIHYSALSQINTKNVRSLRIAWTFDSGDAYPGSDMQCNPIVVDGVMYVTTPKLRVVALDAATGKQIWSFDGWKGQRAPHPNRGVTYWTDGKESRILFTLGRDILSLDARTGKIDPNFGDGGKVDMRNAFDRPPEDIDISATSPGAIYRDLYILGSTTSEMLPAAPGDIRAYDVRSGKLRWSFHTIPHPGEFGYKTWPPEAWKTSGAANDWAGLTVDVKRGLVYAPTGSAAFDFYGADRHGDNLFADTLLCLDAATGKLKWHFQDVRHDVWDLDFPSPPLLVRVRRNGKLIDAVAQAGKNGYVYVLDRETGKSLFPLAERAVPPSKVDGELLAETQIVPLKPAPFVRQDFTEETVTHRTQAAHDAVLAELRKLDHGPMFTPPSLKGTVNFPGLAGGAEWGGQAYDPETHLYYVNANELGWIVRLITPHPVDRSALVSALYRYRCAACHGPDRKGSPPEYPALDHLEGRLTPQQIKNILHSGSGRMPSFAALGDDAIDALQAYLLHNTDRRVTVKVPARSSPGLKYTVEAYKKFLDPDGYPASTPPWGTLAAINLDTGDYAWRIPLGQYPELVAKGMKDTGTENHGGGAVTAGGLFFIGATHYDNKFRAFDKKTGKLLWETVLPNAANATPSIYEVNGKEYVVVAAGGGRERPSGGTFIAFALR